MTYEQYGEEYEVGSMKSLYAGYLDRLMPRRFRGVNVEVRTSVPEIAEIFDTVFAPRNDLNGERIVFHLGSEGKRASAYTDKTGYVFHERLVLLGAKIAFDKGLAVSLPYAFPTAADELAYQCDGNLLRYFNCPCDDTDKKARQIAKRFDNAFVRDSLILIAMILTDLSEREIPLEEAVAEIPEFHSSQRFVSVNGSPPELLRQFAQEEAGWGEGVVFRNNASRALIRPLKSGNGIMVFAESFQSESASAICDEIEKKIKAAQTAPDVPDSEPPISAKLVKKLKKEK